MGKIITIINVISLWKIFVKMGKEGWKSIIPIYNIYALFDSVYGNGLKALTLLIPFYNFYVIIKFNFDYAKAFGQDNIFGLGLLFLAPVFQFLLAFGNYEFRGGNYAKEDDIILDVEEKIRNKFTVETDADKLQELNRLFNEGIISEEEFQNKRKDILERM